METPQPNLEKTKNKESYEDTIADLKRMISECETMIKKTRGRIENLEEINDNQKINATRFTTATKR